MQSSPKALRYMPGASRIVISTQKNKKQKKNPVLPLLADGGGRRVEKPTPSSHLEARPLNKFSSDNLSTVTVYEIRNNIFQPKHFSQGKFS
jgi:hypothetical protein